VDVDRLDNIFVPYNYVKFLCDKMVKCLSGIRCKTQPYSDLSVYGFECKPNSGPGHAKLQQKHKF
jgi:hypothetical protein